MSFKQCKPFVEVFAINFVAELIGASYVLLTSKGLTIEASIVSMLYFLSFILTTRVIVKTDRTSIVGTCLIARGLGTYSVLHWMTP